MTWQVLLVEDDTELCEALSDILRAHGYCVRTAANGEEALRHVRALRPAVIVLDLMMPVMDGPTFLDHRAADPLLASVPVVVLTAQPDRVPVSGVLGVLGKPLQLGRLLALIRIAFDRPFGAPPLAKGTMRNTALPDLRPPVEPRATVDPVDHAVTPSAAELGHPTSPAGAPPASWAPGDGSSP